MTPKIQTTIGALVSSGVLEFGDGYRTKRSEHGQPGYRIIRVADVMDDSVSFDGPDFVSESHTKTIGAKLGRPGDILLTTKGSVGRVAILPETDRIVVYSPQLCYFRIADPARINRRYLRYWFSSTEFRTQADDRMNNTDMAAYINMADIRSLEIALPPIAEQQAIAEVLGAVDDKIAANTKFARTADEYLSALFASRVSNATAAMSLGEIADVNAITVKPSQEGQLRYIDIASVKVGWHVTPELTDWADAPSRARRGVRQGDTIWSTVRPNRRSHSLNLSDDPLLVGSTGLAVLSPRHVGFAYLYEVSRRAEFTTQLENLAEGSAYPAIRADRFKTVRVPMLSGEEYRDFERIAAPLREQAHSLMLENDTLSTTRDALLSHLLSGSIQVKHAE